MPEMAVAREDEAQHAIVRSDEKLIVAVTSRGLRSVPTPGSTTTRWTVPGGKKGAD